MKKIIKRIEIITNSVNLWFPDLMEIEKFSEIFKLFHAKYLFAKFYLESDVAIENDFNFNDSAIRILKKSHSKKMNQYAVCFPLEYSVYLISIADKYNTTLEIVSGILEDWEIFLFEHNLSNSPVSFVVNDNNGSGLTFDSRKFNTQNIIDNIEEII